MIYLLRHAQSLPDAQLPEADWPLSARGSAQAKELIPVLQRLGPRAVYSSPYRRALDTVRPFARHAGLPVHIEEDLREKKLSRKMIPDFLEMVRRSWEDFDFALPGCETNRQCQDRVVRVVLRLARRHREEPILLSSHGNAIGLLLNAVDERFGFEQWKSLRSPDLHRLGAIGDRR